MPSTAQVPEGTETLLVEEVVLFLSVHLGRSPGLMWLEHEPPDPDTLAEFLPAALARRLDRPISVLPDAFGDVRTAHDLLVCQLGGSDTWRLAPPAGAGLTLRLRAGDVLYVPTGSLCTPRRGARSRALLLALGAPESDEEEEESP
ncbi:hypothetical protein [Streptomyces lavendulae]|uniref:hypothetical protein n=1 Tax=Streptomyces lavendulae TaxID=1914 RepID=UPI0024A586C5|nr:hypothetical protein [Streptomyces lavendulae]GLX22969.1 hypothetical protein Slala01_66130 [Streptomyces lavendulae subsp. lavendulae]GLX30431.1 hypothetical protein Slala02_62510 [Streptomyces lavendulae subsp. lavendulae]